MALRVWRRWSVTSPEETCLRGLGRCGSLQAMVPESPLESTEHGLVPKGEGWFVLNARDAPWFERDKFGSACIFEGEPRRAFENVDVILTPASPTVAFKIGEKTGDPLSLYLSDIFTITQPLAGIPAISIPCGKNSGGLPVGMQLMANHFQESLLLRVAHHFEKAGGFTL